MGPTGLAGPPGPPGTPGVGGALDIESKFLLVSTIVYIQGCLGGGGGYGV